VYRRDTPRSWLVASAICGIQRDNHAARRYISEGGRKRPRLYPICDVSNAAAVFNNGTCTDPTCTNFGTVDAGQADSSDWSFAQQF
jgi:hypothetical protein